MKHTRKYILILFSFLFSLPCFPREIEFSLITCGPGSEIYELEGHTGLRVILPDGEDWIANWGVFNFNEPNFVYRFVSGQTDYMMAMEPTSHFLERYRRDNRTVYEQPLKLSETEAERLLELLHENSLPQNRIYRYNYVRDNCATRPLQMIGKAIGDSLELHGQPQFKSFRDAMTVYHKDYSWYQFGIDLALGSGIDSRLNLKEECFAPVRLHELFESATRRNGETITTGSRQLVIPDNPLISKPTPGLLSPIAVCWTLFAITLTFCLGALGRKRPPVIWNSILFALFGITGLVTTFLIFISTHEATSPNWLFLWTNPLPLVIAVTLYIKKAENLTFWLQITNFVAVFGLLIVAIAGVQVLNPAFYPLIISSLMCSFTYIYTIRWQRKHRR